MTFLRKYILPVLTVTIAAAPLAAQEFSYRFQSADPAGNPNYELQQGWTRLVSEMTEGRVEITLLPVDAVVAHNETQEAIGAGILDGHISDVSYFAGRDPAFGLVANPVGAWSDPQQMLDFMAQGGGAALMNELENPYGLYFIGATTPGLEAFVSTVPLDGVDDLMGLKMRAPEGLVQQVFAAAGAAPVNLPASEVFTSLDKKVIDAADYSVFSTNQAQGLNEIATHPIYPGFHSMPLIEISMNLNKWNALPVDLQETLRVSVAQFAQTQVATLKERDEAAVEEAKAGGVITVHDWSEDERARFRGIAVEQWAAVAARSENAQKVYDALTGYLSAEGLLRE